MQHSPRQDPDMISSLMVLVLLSVAAVVVLAGGGWPTLGRDARPYLVAIGIFWVAPLALMLGLHVVLPGHNADGRCNGLGFGCVPAPADAVVFVWAMTLPFTFTAGLIACAIIAAVRRRRGGED